MLVATFPGAVSGFVHASGYVLRGRLLLLGRSGNGRRDAVHLLDRPSDLLDRGNSLMGILLDASDLGGDFLGRPRRLVRKFLDLGGDDGKAFACFTRPSGFNRRVEREQVRLTGDRGDQLDDIPDALGAVRKGLHPLVGLARLRDGVGRDHGRLGDLGANLAGRGGKLLGRGCHRLYVRGCLLRGCGNGPGLLPALFGVGGHRLGGRFELMSSARDPPVRGLADSRHAWPSLLGLPRLQLPI